MLPLPAFPLRGPFVLEQAGAKILEGAGTGGGQGNSRPSPVGSSRTLVSLVPQTAYLWIPFQSELTPEPGTYTQHPGCCNSHASCSFLLWNWPGWVLRASPFQALL